MFLPIYEILGYGAVLILIGMIFGWMIYRKVLKYDKENLELAIEGYVKDISDLEQHNAWLRQSNQACYNQGLADGEKKKIKELGSVMLSESYVLNNGTVVFPSENFYRPKRLGPKH